MDQSAPQSSLPTNPSPLPTPQQSPMVESKPNGNLKMLMIVIVVLVVLAALGGGGYWYYTTQMAPPQEVNSNTNVTTTLPKPSPQDSLENEANSVDESPVENDLTPVDKDIIDMNSTASASAAPKK
jgi:flagellar basal body-associated protein FliL